MLKIRNSFQGVGETWIDETRVVMVRMDKRGWADVWLEGDREPSISADSEGALRLLARLSTAD